MTLIQNIVESSLSGVIRAYNEWLGPEFHNKRDPFILDCGKAIVFCTDRTEKSYVNWLVWTVHGFDAVDGSANILRVRIKVSGDDIFDVNFEATGEYSMEDALAFNSIILKDLHNELKAYTTREGWPSENINVY